jgi:signal peptidase I
VATTSEQSKISEEERHEAALIAAADEGGRAYYKVAGFTKLFTILAAAAVSALIAHQRLHKQDYLFGSLAAFATLFILSMITSTTRWGFVSRVRGEANSLRKTAVKLLGKNRGKISEPAALEVEQATERLDAALGTDRGGLSARTIVVLGLWGRIFNMFSGAGASSSAKLGPIVQARVALDAVLDKHLAFARKSAAREYTESIGGAILVALLLRAFVFEPFHIPSGSMIPTLLVGDFIFVNKMSYGLRIPFTDPAKVHKIGEKAPNRGDVIVFIVPSRPDVDYVKRVIGLPGDKIEVRDNQLWLNGVLQVHEQLADYSYSEHSEYTDSDIELTANQYVEDLAGKKHKIITRKEPMYSRNGTFVVEPGRFFVMGDNRDNSLDSRVDGGPGQVPFSYIKGRASLIWTSFGGDYGIRFERLFNWVN